MFYKAPAGRCDAKTILIRGVRKPASNITVSYSSILGASGPYSFGFCLVGF